MCKRKWFFILFTILSLIGCKNDLAKRLDLVEIDEKWRNGDLIEAKAAIDTYLDQEPENELAWTMLGHIESDFDSDSLAIIAYENALELNPKTVEAITGMGIIFRKKGEYEKASEYYYHAISIDPEYAEAYSSLVVINLKRRKFEEAVNVGLKGYELDKKDGTIAANLAASYHFMNDTVQREKYFDIAQKNGYRNAESLRKIFEGELTIFD